MISSVENILEPMDNDHSSRPQPRHPRIHRWGARLDRWGRVVFWPAGVVSGVACLLAAFTAYHAAAAAEWIGALLFALVALCFGWLAAYSLSSKRRLTDLES